MLLKEKMVGVSGDEWASLAAVSACLLPAMLQCLYSIKKVIKDDTLCQYQAEWNEMTTKLNEIKKTV